MKCKQCGSKNVTVKMERETTGAVVKKVSLLRKLGRLTLIMLTCGFWLLVPKKKETHKNTYRTYKKCTCRECGAVWNK